MIRLQALAESDRRYPPHDAKSIQRNTNLFDSLYGQYLLVIQDKYGITAAEQEEMVLRVAKEIGFGFQASGRVSRPGMLSEPQCEHDGAVRSVRTES
jgi:hypothetical protein